MLGMNQGSNEVRISNMICRCRFRFDESMLTGIKFVLQVVGNMLMYDNFKYCGKIVQNRQVCNYSLRQWKWEQWQLASRGLRKFAVIS